MVFFHDETYHIQDYCKERNERNRIAIQLLQCPSDIKPGDSSGERKKKKKKDWQFIEKQALKDAAVRVSQSVRCWRMHQPYSQVQQRQESKDASFKPMKRKGMKRRREKKKRKTSLTDTPDRVVSEHGVFQQPNARSH